MSTTTLPAIGDSFTYSALVSRAKNSGTSAWAPAGHREKGRVWVDTPDGRKIKGWARECDLNADRTCPDCYDRMSD